ncbi:14634_t:CDS:2 [Funneliformis geosporum]|nr:14634_t:CDS:2 [Funneliformis geosporum]
MLSLEDSVTCNFPDYEMTADTLVKQMVKNFRQDANPPPLFYLGEETPPLS